MCELCCFVSLSIARVHTRTQLRGATEREATAQQQLARALRHSTRPSLRRYWQHFRFEKHFFAARYAVAVERVSRNSLEGDDTSVFDIATRIRRVYVVMFFRATSCTSFPRLRRNARRSLVCSDSSSSCGSNSSSTFPSAAKVKV